MKIDIIGSVASGKTTLAKKISNRFNVPYYEKDNIVWERTSNGDLKRSSMERDKYFNAIISNDNWIVEGTPRKSLKESFDSCDYIIVLDEYTAIRLVRVFRRWLNQRNGKEYYNTKPTIKFLCWNIKWVFEFNKTKREILQELSKYGNKVRIFKHSNGAFDFISQTYSC